jgi:hypothetical protein
VIGVGHGGGLRVHLQRRARTQRARRARTRRRGVPVQRVRPR